MAITIKDIKVGMTFHDKGRRHTKRVTQIVKDDPNSNGSPYTIVAVNEVTGLTNCYLVSSETQDLSDWLIFDNLTPAYIMTATNGHDPELVKKINQLHSNEGYHTEFYEILTLIATRDLNELVEKGILPEGENLTEELIKATASDILTNVCDDEDLQTILGYCKYKPEEKPVERYYLINFRIPSIGLQATLPVMTKCGEDPLTHPAYLELLSLYATKYKGNVYTKPTRVDYEVYGSYLKPIQETATKQAK